MDSTDAADIRAAIASADHTHPVRFSWWDTVCCWMMTCAHPAARPHMSMRVLVGVPIEANAIDDASGLPRRDNSPPNRGTTPQSAQRSGGGAARWTFGDCWWVTTRIHGSRLKNACDALFPTPLGIRPRPFAHPRGTCCAHLERWCQSSLVDGGLAVGQGAWRTSTDAPDCCRTK